MRRNISGFTIVELLVVIVVIGILAAITIIGYNFVTKDAHDTAVQADLRSFWTLAERYQLKNNGRYPNANDAALESLEWKATKSSYEVASGDGNLYYFVNRTDFSDYILFGRSKSGKIFYITSESSSLKEAGGGITNFTFRGVTWPSRTTEFSSSVYGFAGYSPTDKWRPWAG